MSIQDQHQTCQDFNPLNNTSHKSTVSDSITVEENNVTSQTLNCICFHVLEGMDQVQNAIGK